MVEQLHASMRCNTVETSDSYSIETAAFRQGIKISADSVTSCNQGVDEEKKMEEGLVVLQPRLDIFMIFPNIIAFRSCFPVYHHVFL